MDINGATGEVTADHENGKVVTRFTDPETGDTAVELHLGPDDARNMAASLTAASIAVEEAGRYGSER